MAKRSGCKKADVNTKKLKQVLKAKGGRTKETAETAKRKDAGNLEQTTLCCMRTPNSNLLNTYFTM